MQELPPQFWQGVLAFQQGRFYECHDILEALWIEAQEPDKTFLQGVLQIAVACYHLTNCNWRGAVILLGEGIRRLSSYEPSYGQVDVEHFLNTSAHLLNLLQTSGADEVSTIAAQIAPSTGSTQTGPLVPILRTWRELHP
ncbi:MAG TPA: DUF309 domain-containing protein [Stenomitos sp.]